MYKERVKTANTKAIEKEKLNTKIKIAVNFKNYDILAFQILKNFKWHVVTKMFIIYEVLVIFFLMIL